MTIRLATAALSGHIYAGTPNKEGTEFKGKRHDVTSDALKAIIEKIGIGNVMNVEIDGKPSVEISIKQINS